LVCKDIADSLDNSVILHVIVLDISKASDFVPHDRPLMKFVASGVKLKVVVWIREFLLGRTQRVRVRGKLSEEIRVTSGVPQGSVLSPHVSLAYVNDIWKNIESTARLLVDDCNM